jgi:hypothetical protein
VLLRSGGAPRPQPVLEPGAAEQRAGGRGGEVGLLAALRGLDRTLPRQLGHRARSGGDRHEGQQADPVLVRGDREAPGRRDVEEVVGQRTEHRRGDAEPQAPVGADHEDDEQVDDAEREDRGDLAQAEEQRGGARDPEHGGDRAGGEWGTGLAEQERLATRGRHRCGRAHSAVSGPAASARRTICAAT